MLRDPVTIQMDLDPKGKERPRLGAGGAVYTPRKTSAYEVAVGFYARTAMRGREPFDGPVRATIIFTLPVPLSWKKSLREAALDGLVLPKGKPDIDNLAKAILDALNKIVWNDDATVVQLMASKRYGRQGHINVVVSAIEGLDDG